MVVEIVTIWELVGTWVPVFIGICVLGAVYRLIMRKIDMAIIDGVDD